MSERANDLAQQSAPAKQAGQSKQGGVSRAKQAGQSEQGGASKQVSGANKRANGRANGPVLQSGLLVILDHSAYVESSKASRVS